MSQQYRRSRFTPTPPVFGAGGANVSYVGNGSSLIGGKLVTISSLQAVTELFCFRTDDGVGGFDGFYVAIDRADSLAVFILIWDGSGSGVFGKFADSAGTLGVTYAQLFPSSTQIDVGSVAALDAGGAGKGGNVNGAKYTILGR